MKLWHAFGAAALFWPTLGCTPANRVVAVELNADDGGSTPVGINKDEEVVLTDAGSTIVSYGGYLNGESSQQEFRCGAQQESVFRLSQGLLRASDETWTRNALGLPAVASFRAKLAISGSGNAYAILPDLRIAGASAASNFTDWTLLSAGGSGRFFSDPLIDTDRLASDGKLSIFYPQKGSSDVYVLDYTLQ